MVNVTAIMSKGPRIRKGSVLTDIKNTSVIEFDDISEDEMNKMIDGTLTEFDEGDLIDGTVVKIEHDEVLVDIGFKSEGGLRIFLLIKNYFILFPFDNIVRRI